jgi:hypothetical protein
MDNDLSNLSISSLIEFIGKTKAQGAEAYKIYKEVKESEEQLKFVLMEKLKEVGLKSAKGEEYTASLSEKPRVVIKDESAVIEWLKNAPNVEEDFYIGVKRTEFQSLATSLLKETGELIDGTDVQVTESLSVRANTRAKA